MKKILSLLLIFIFCVTSTVFVNAQNYTGNKERDGIIHTILNNFSDDEILKRTLANISPYEMMRIYFYFQSIDSQQAEKINNIYYEISTPIKFQEYEEVRDKWSSEFGRMNASDMYESFSFAYLIGLTTAKDFDSFEPTRNISREEVAAVLIRAVQNGYAPELLRKYEPKVFKDAHKIAPEFKNSIEILSRAGIFRGDANGNFRPKDKVTLKESIILMVRIFTEQHNLTDDENMEFYETVTNGVRPYKTLENTPTSRIQFFYMLYILYKGLANLVENES